MLGLRRAVSGLAGTLVFGCFPLYGQGFPTTVVLACQYQSTYDLETHKNERTAGTKTFAIILFPDKTASVKKEGLGAELTGRWDDASIIASAAYSIGYIRSKTTVNFSRYTGQLRELFEIENKKGGLVHHSTCSTAQPKF